MEIDMKGRDAQTLSNKTDVKRPAPRNIIIKMPEIKGRDNLKNSKRKSVSYLHGSSHKTVS